MFTRNFENITCWYNFFMTIIAEDASAAAAIVSYYLDNIEGYCRIFCPLGNDDYEFVGHAMRDNTEIFEAAVDTGLMCSGIQTILGAALDGWDNWDCSKAAILHIMEDPRLNGYIGIEDRFLIDHIKNIVDEDAWDEAYDHSVELLKSACRKGYAY